MKNENIKDIVDDLARLCGSVASSFLPTEAKNHFRRAAKEFLFGMVAIVDEKGRCCDRDSSDEDEAASRKINID
ncbi:MAG: hypothetical protein FWD78_17905 [Treponema sp.]|nr:hypothetical protein [Treponema sp.]